MDDLKRWVSVKAFFFLLLPHASAPLNTVPEEEQPFKQGCQRQSSFSCCLLLLCLGRAKTHVGKEGPAFFADLFPSTCLFIAFLSLGQGNQNGWMKMRKTLVRALFCLPRSRAEAELPGLGSLPRGCWVISKVLMCLISQGLWKIWERDRSWG